MWNWVYLIPLVAIVFPIVFIICYYLLKIKRAEVIRAAIEKGIASSETLAWIENEKSDEARKHEKEMALIEQGLYEQYKSRSSLKSGIIVSSLGVAFTIYSIVTWGDISFPGEENYILLAGLILLFLGVGLIIYHYLADKTSRTEASHSGDESSDN